MPTRFYFHLVKGRQRLYDRVGLDVSLARVLSPAALALAKDQWPGLDDDEAWAGWSIEVVDADGRVVRTIALVE